MQTVPETDAPPCGFPSVFSVTASLSFRAHVFGAESVLDNLEAFASLAGPEHYRLPENEHEITLEVQDAPAAIPARIQTGEGPVTAFDPGHDLFWNVAT